MRPTDNRSLLNTVNQASDPDYYGVDNRALLNAANQPADPQYYASVPDAVPQAEDGATLWGYDPNDPSIPDNLRNRPGVTFRTGGGVPPAPAYGPLHGREFTVLPDVTITGRRSASSAGTVTGAPSDAVIASLRSEQMARIQAMAAQTATDSYSGVYASGDPYIEIRGVGNSGNAQQSYTTGSESADEAILTGTAGLLSVASVVHGAAEFVSDQVWMLGNVGTGGWLSQNNSFAHDAVSRNIARSQAILGMPQQLSTLALRTMTGNWHGMDPLNSNQINALNAQGDRLGAKVLAGQTALGIVGAAAGGAGLVRNSFAVASPARMGVQMAVENGAANLAAPRTLSSQFGGVRVGGVSEATIVSPQSALQGVVNRAVNDLNANPALARDLMSPGSYQHLVEGTNLAAASYGKAVERLAARYVRADAGLSSTLTYQSRPFVSTPDFIGHSGYDLHLLDITTKASIPAHELRSYGPATKYVIHPGLPKNLVFPR